MATEEQIDRVRPTGRGDMIAAATGLAEQQQARSMRARSRRRIPATRNKHIGPSWSASQALNRIAEGGRFGTGQAGSRYLQDFWPL